MARSFKTKRTRLPRMAKPSSRSFVYLWWQRERKKRRGGGSSPPAQIQLSALTIGDDASIGDTLGALSVTNGSGTYTFTLLDDAGGFFDIDGDDVEAAGALTTGSVDIEVEADNGVDTPITRIFTIIISDETSPTITSGNAFNVLDGEAFSEQLTASESGTWAKTGGADTALFTLSAGGLLQMTAKSFASPTDADANNTYVVQVTFTDTAAQPSTPQTITVTVVEVGGAPSMDFSNPANSQLLAILADDPF